MVTVYSKPNCLNCDITKRLLDKANIAYQVVDLSKDSAALEKVKADGFTTAPVVYTDDDAWCGVRPDKITALQKKLFNKQ